MVRFVIEPETLPSERLNVPDRSMNSALPRGVRARCHFFALLPWFTAQFDDIESALVASVDHMEESHLSSLKAASRDSELVVLQVMNNPRDLVNCDQKSIL